MVNYLNKHNLSAPIFRALTHDDYDQHDSFATVTQLIDAPHIWKLSKTANVNVDCTRRFYAMFGSAIHSLIDKVSAGFVSEMRCYVDVLDKKISGKADIYDTKTKTITDYKVVSKYMVRYGKHKPEWEKQLNLLAYIYTKNDLPVNQLKITAIVRDLLPQDKLTRDFPDIPIVEFDIPIWTTSEQEKYLVERVRLFMAYETSTITSHCSEAERWRSESKFAVKKPQNKTAYRLLDNAEEAGELAREKGMIVEIRPGADRRCLEYCDYIKVCEYAKEAGYDLQTSD